MQQARTRSFALATVGLPILLIGAWALSGALDDKNQSDSALESLTKAQRLDLPVGYVDKGGLLRSLPPNLPDALLIPFAAESEAASALEQQQIGAYYVLPADFKESGKAQRVSPRLPLVTVDKRMVEWVIVWNLLPGRSAEDVAALWSPFSSGGLQFIPIGDQGLAKEGQQENSLAAFFVAVVIVMPLFMAGGYLLQGVAQEKENRVLEILLVSLRPWQLLAGKLLGLSALTLVQFGGWILVGGAMMTAMGRDPAAFLRQISLLTGDLALAAAFAAGGFILYATLMAGLGAVAPNVEATRMWALLIGSPMMLPLFLGTSIISSPNGPVAIVLSILPFSSPVGMLMRLMATEVPAWELGLSLALLGATSILMILLISRIFRASTLLSGQPISIRRFWEAARS